MKEAVCNLPRWYMRSIKEATLLLSEVEITKVHVCAVEQTIVRKAD